MCRGDETRALLGGVNRPAMAQREFRRLARKSSAATLTSQLFTLLLADSHTVIPE